MSDQGLLRPIGDTSLHVAWVEVLHGQDVIKQHVEPSVTALLTKHELHLVLRAHFKVFQRQSHLRRIRSSSAPTNAADRKSTRLNSSHLVISYAVFCLK